ncbi:BRCA1-associated RING domain protein 1-like isoform X1 [Diprion similis]|uniref:BRCA1-associated RING domain protein 1-like isoform X1 n=1 Tax=Diprion similis TaxID=362088 RepID=UPI001EF904F7|nr:BRCA1-associated RING domain protein 1-like isoform X1 [Diprion similis]XP_046741308.1 BRCA1-associated RING domain protein 1-like isoform X1 [Diprion similis]XP_046741309.1 BRCA1-associated RING domain protein 1-like isoform X1 [Diprion similis]XP_046741310.1 BRCA1-associated RING domain protein 1-like isoform X1 [Diprion similis]
MDSNKVDRWSNTQAALKDFMINFSCNKCNYTARDPIRYQKCDHLFCTTCIGSKSQCPACNTPANRNEVYSDKITEKLIGYGNIISQIVHKTQSPMKVDNKTLSSNLSATEHNVSIKSQTIPKNVNKPNMKGETPLHKACLKRNIERVRSLLEAGADPNTQDNAKWTPLFEAVSYGYYEICKLLLEAGAHPDTPVEQNRTALHAAVNCNDIEMIKLLLQYRADVNACDSSGKTPLDYASEEVHKILTCYKPAENMLEKSLSSISNITASYNNTLTSNGTHVLGLDLSSESQLLLSKLASKHKIKTVKTFTAAVTHVVVEANDQYDTPVNYVVLLAILHGDWILVSELLRHCANLTDLTTIELEFFEVQGTTNARRSGAPTRARENTQKKNPRLFNGCNFFFAINNQSTYTFGDLQFTKLTLSKLITEGEGKVLHREPDPESIRTNEEIPFHVARDVSHPLHSCSHYIIYVPGMDEPQIQYNMPHIKSLPLIWLIESIEQFKLLDPAEIGIIPSANDV